MDAESDKGACLKTVKILIADDEEDNRHLLENLLKRLGYETAQAVDGEEAVKVFMLEQPDMVLMDVLMPGIDGYEATRRIRELAGEHMVPIIFITALQDPVALAKCIECGGSDFLTKPFNFAILRAKIAALLDLRNLYETLRDQRNQLADHHKRVQREQDVAEQVFAKVMANDLLNSPNIHYLLSPLAVFNGDLLLAARSPSGGLHLMIGDFTGHGLSAAIGAIPVSDIFYGMTAKGFSISDIVAEINGKLRRVLPPGLFLAACLLELDLENRLLSVWNGGIPDILVYDGQVKARLVSRHFPLGVVGNDRLETAVEVALIDPDDRIYAYTDGVTELNNPYGERYGDDRLDQCFVNNCRPERLFTEICNDLATFRAGDEQSDDITLIEIRVPEQCESAAPEDVASIRPRDPMNWHLRLELGTAILRGFDPLPHLLQMMMEIQHLQPHKQRIYMILAELFSNALEHGLLQLDSSLKVSPGGFGEYYQRRAERLEQLDQGWIRFDLEHVPTDSGGSLTIRIDDSGTGFDYSRKSADLAENLAYHGRGIPLVKSLCQSLTYLGKGNQVEAVYLWQAGTDLVEVEGACDG